MKAGLSDRDSNKLLLLEDIEFIQMLSNLEYIRYIVSKGFLQDRSFLDYLRYLEYLKSPRYSHLIAFPRSLSMLKILCDENVQELVVADDACLDTIVAQEVNQIWASEYEWETKMEINNNHQKGI